MQHRPLAASVTQFRAFLARRLDPSTFLGLHLTVSLIVAAAGVWLFASLVDAVLDRAVMVRFDQFADRMIHSQTTPLGLAFFNFMSRIGSPLSMTIVAVAGGIFLLLRRWPTLLVTWVAVFAGASVLEQILKRVVHRTRPPYGTQYLNGYSFSFPSGHSMWSLVGCSMLLYVVFLAFRPRHGLRTFLMCLGAVFVLLVGASRVYLGVHYPSDVLGGWAVGSAWVATCLSVAGIVLHHRGIALSA